jgi:hypothetical protein
MRFWRSHVIRFTLVNPVSGSSNTVTTVSPMMPCCESGSPGAGSVAVPSLLDGVPTPLMVMDANAPRVDRHLPLRRNAPLRPLRGCFPVADPSSSRAPACPWAVRPRKNLLVTPPWFLASQADAIADAARRAASMGAMLPKTRGESAVRSLQKLPCSSQPTPPAPAWTPSGRFDQTSPIDGRLKRDIKESKGRVPFGVGAFGCAGCAGMQCPPSNVLNFQRRSPARFHLPSLRFQVTRARLAPPVPDSAS